jgi:predicted alpha/beta hydrolase
MYSSTTLDIRGHRGQAVPNTFFAQDSETHHLAVVFPGLGYTAHMPALYYPRRLLLERGADVLLVEYDYRGRVNFRMPRDPERDRWFFEDVAAACAAGLGQRPYSGVTLVGKSLGTRAMGYLLTEDARLSPARCMWLTPLLRADRLRAQMRQVRGRSLFVIGTADSHYDPAYLEEVRLASGGESVVIQGADHSLEIEGDTVGSIRAVEQTVRAMQRFLDHYP